jgi:hypothetical protein
MEEGITRNMNRWLLVEPRATAPCHAIAECGLSAAYLGRRQRPIRRWRVSKRRPSQVLAVGCGLEAQLRSLEHL